MPLNEASSRRTSMVQASDTLQLAHKTSLTAAESRYNRRLSVSSQASTIYGRKRSYVMPRFGNSHSTDPAAAQITPKFLNSYKTEPDKDKRFRVKAVTDIIDGTLKEKLEGLEYSSERARRMVASISEEIKAAVKTLGFDRYKLVCIVHIGSLNDQDLRIASRCLWDDAFDRIASSSFCNETLFACVSVFGVYRE